MTPAPFARLFLDSALRGIETLDVAIERGVTLLSELGEGMRDLLRGAPKLQQLRLRLNGTITHMSLLTHLIHQLAPDGCVVDIVMNVDDQRLAQELEALEVPMTTVPWNVRVTKRPQPPEGGRAFFFNGTV